MGLRAVYSRPLPLAQAAHNAYIGRAKLRRSSEAIISPGPYRSFRELSLAGSVDPVIWCPPTFVGNSGIERSNGDCGFALFVRSTLFLRHAWACPRPSFRGARLRASPKSITTIGGYGFRVCAQGGA